MGFRTLFLLGILLVPRAVVVSATMLSGQAIDDKGAPISGAAVTVQDEEAQDQLKTLTTQEGSFHFPRLGPGEYRLVVQKPGYRVVECTVKLAEGTQMQVIVRVPETANAQRVDADRPTSGTPRRRQHLTQGPAGRRASGISRVKRCCRPTLSTAPLWACSASWLRSTMQSEDNRINVAEHAGRPVHPSLNLHRPCPMYVPPKVSGALWNLFAQPHCS